MSVAATSLGATSAHTTQDTREGISCTEVLDLLVKIQEKTAVGAAAVRVEVQLIETAGVMSIQGLRSHPAKLCNLAQLHDAPQPHLGAVLELSNQRGALGDFTDDLHADKDLRLCLAVK